MDRLSTTLIAAVSVIVAAVLLATFLPDGDDEKDPKKSAVEKCSLATPGSAVSLELPGCQVLASDTASEPDPLPFWGQIACQEESRHRHIAKGGDTHPRADGAEQEGDGFRRLRALDGDNYFGERCELGQNDHAEAPNAFYRDGQRRVTFISVRVPADLPLGGDVFQVVMQMKQTGPSDNSGGTPVLALEAFGNRWQLRQSKSAGSAGHTRELWSAPIQPGVWTRFAFDVTYSDDPAVGRIKVYADLNGDSAFDGSGEQSEELRTYTLKTEIPGSDDDGISAGEPIPSHLRAGIYHNPSYKCPPPGGCYVDIDNVQVVAP